MSVVETGSVERRGAIKTRAGDPSEPPLKKKTKKSQFWFRFRSRNRRRRRGEKKNRNKNRVAVDDPNRIGGANVLRKRSNVSAKTTSFTQEIRYVRSQQKKNRKNVVAEERTRTDFVGDRRRRTVLFFWFTPQKRKTVVRMVPGFPKKKNKKRVS